MTHAIGSACNRKRVSSNIQEGAVVVTVAVNVAGLLPFGVAEAGESVQTASEGAPVQVSVTVPLNPLMGVTCKL